MNSSKPALSPEVESRSLIACPDLLRKPSGVRAPGLSKSRYVVGLICPRRLWLETYARAEATPIDDNLQAIFDQGNEVGRVAQGRHPGGVLVDEDHTHHAEAERRTRTLLGDRAVPALFEGAFGHGGVVIRADILARAGRGSWDLVEVKSSTKVKDPNLDDVSVQLWVLERAGLKVRRPGLLTINTAYVYQGGE